MKHVYLIKSISNPEKRYTGIASDLGARLTAHNEGRSKHTSKYRPWRLITAISFTDAKKAQAFEHYLKTGSGRAFANKRLW
jgi:predicted GIY-YIG superfamily endonuclease